MSSVDLKSDIVTNIALPLDNYGIDIAEGNIIDMTGAYGLTFVAISSGISAAGAIEIKIEHSDVLEEDNFEDVPDRFMIGNITLTSEAPEAEVQTVGYVGKKRYVRCYKAASTVESAFGISAIKYTLRHTPATSIPPVISSVDFLLTEAGGKLLLEDDGRIIL